MRTSKLNVVQFEYGGDGLDPSLMEPNKRPVEFKRLTANTLVRGGTLVAHVRGIVWGVHSGALWFGVAPFVINCRHNTRAVGRTCCRQTS